MVTKGFEGRLAREAGTHLRKLPRRARRQQSMAQASLQFSLSGRHLLIRARDMSGSSLSCNRVEESYSQPHFSIWMTWMNWMNKRYYRWGWRVRSYFPKAWAIWKLLQATELWQSWESQEPAGFPDLADMSVRPPVCCAVSREEDHVALHAWWWHWANAGNELRQLPWAVQDPHISSWCERLPAKWRDDVISSTRTLPSPCIYLWPPPVSLPSLAQ